MQFGVLGPLVIERDGGTVTVDAAKPRSLLAVLIVQANRVVSADALIDALWGEAPPASAAKLVQVYVSQLRRDLPGLPLATKPFGYQLSLSPEELDSSRFEALLRDGRAALLDSNPGLAAQLLARGLELWRGPAYADVAGSTCAMEAARLEELRVTALEERVDADLLAGGDPSALVPELRALVARHPLRERLWGQLMKALYGAQQPAAALEVYAAARAAFVDALGVEPGPQLRELHQAILRQEVEVVAHRPSAVTPAAIPAAATPLVGRDAELDRLHELAGQPDVRLLTLSGPGGAGKSRLALALAERMRGECAHGAAFVPLASIDDPTLVPGALARALDIRETGRTPLVVTLLSALAPLEMLIVLDNFEQVLGASAFVADLLAAAPRLTIVVTSRSLLRLTSEHIYAVPTLAVPGPDETPDALARNASVRLFAARAKAVRPEFELDAGNAAVIADVCRRLEGLPLAIELAAARLRVLTPVTLRERLTHQLDVLAAGARDLPPRHQTLRATLDWSYDLLDERSRSALNRLSVFAGDASLAAVEAVCSADLELVSQLSDQSLVLVGAESGEPRVSLLETTRAYAAEQLTASGDEDTARRAHSAYFLWLAEDADGRVTGADQAAALALLEVEHDNLRAAIDWCVAAGEPELELRLTAALGRFWYVRGHLSEGRARLTAALSRATSAPDVLRARALRSTSALALIQGDYAGARSLSAAALTLYRDLGDEIGVVRSLSNLGAAVLADGDYERARDVLDETVERARRLDEPRLTALALNNRGDVALTEGDYPLAVGCFEESLALLRELGDTANVARSLLNLGSSALELADYDQARAYLDESLARSVDVGDVEDQAWSLVALAALEARTGDAQRAGVLLGASERLLLDLDALFKPYERALFARTEDEVRAALGAQGCADAKGAGAALSAADATLLAGERRP